MNAKDWIGFGLLALIVTLLVIDTAGKGFSDRKIDRIEQRVEQIGIIAARIDGGIGDISRGLDVVGSRIGSGRDRIAAAETAVNSASIANQSVGKSASNLSQGIADLEKWVTSN